MQNPIQWLGRVIVLLVLLFSTTTKAEGILVLGDSLSAGYGLKTGEGWVTLLQTKLKQQGYAQPVINASISGETSQGGLTRLPALLRQHQPDLVLIELGGNDGLRGLPLSQLSHNLSQMIQYSLAANARPVLLGIQLPPNYGRRYTQAFAQLYPDLAAQFQIPVMPFILEGIGTKTELMQADGIHPKAQAQAQILDNIWPVLAPELGLN
ncbi:acyl-CoA thioesterase-1 [Oceanospirillum multiglobuliferum]|uniref:Arylesterase n=1 Tax=Oceanospirillum multiglobuliferum TaxID=64969 RepID=A0A1T4QKP0_9GAMM|nr:arylesterase [Oceanospirillum multiglobuliferum]OPX56403.1 arylesterase [Oceanospirillum multiglobuliferum]SKA03818.1 acyl-CoA thioesterase-1 [Oceanospirillum multiglobuliferum]